MKKLIIGLLLLFTCYAGIAQDEQVFVAKSVTHMKMNAQKKDWDIVSKDEGFISITYGKDYVQFGEDPRARFILFGPVTNHQDEQADYVIQACYNYQGKRMTVSTMYGRKKKFIRVAVDMKTDLFMYTLKYSEE